MRLVGWLVLHMSLYFIKKVLTFVNLSERPAANLLDELEFLAQSQLHDPKQAKKHVIIANAYLLLFIFRVTII